MYISWIVSRWKTEKLGKIEGLRQSDSDRGPVENNRISKQIKH